MLIKLTLMQSAPITSAIMATAVAAILLLLVPYGCCLNSSMESRTVTQKSGEGLVYNAATDSPQSSEEHTVFDGDAEATGDGQRFILHAEALPWLEAARACWRLGQQLAVPRSRRDAEALGRVLVASAFNVTQTTMIDAIHVGVHNISRGDKWRTLDGLLLSEAGYDLWMEGGSGGCSALLADGRYLRQRCASALAYACEAPPAPSGAALAAAAAAYTEIGGAGRFRLHEQPLPWALAQRRCEAEGAALAVPASAREAGLLAGVLVTRAAHARVRRRGFFVGITDVAAEGDWRTVAGLPLMQTGYATWGAGEPSGGRQQNCGALLPDGRYADAPCLVPLAFCCQLRGPHAADDERVFESGRYRLYVERLPWLDSLQACHRQNASLAVPMTAEEEVDMKNLINAARSESADFGDFVHVGIHDVEESGLWRTLAGNAAWTSKHFYQDSRTYFRAMYYGENGYCGKLGYDGKYGRQSCGDKRPYVCEVNV